jgi:hypothetical protein
VFCDHRRLIISAGQARGIVFDHACQTIDIAYHTSGENLVENVDLGSDSLGKIRGQAASSGSASQDPPRVILCSAQRSAHREIVPDLVKDTLSTASTAATTTTMRYIR